jgi:hypothetical protein
MNKLDTKSTIFWDMTLCSPLSFNRRFEGTYRLHLQGRRNKSSTLKMKAICSSETSVETQCTTRRHIPEDDTLHNHHCENLKSYKLDTNYYKKLHNKLTSRSQFSVFINPSPLGH